MRDNTQDKTIYRNYISKWKYLIKDYELVKSKKHPKFRFVSDFYQKTSAKSTLKLVLICNNATENRDFQLNLQFSNRIGI